MLYHILLLNQIYVYQLLCNVLFCSSRDNKPLKMSSDLISEGLIFKIFWGGHAPRLPRFGMLRMPDCVLHTQ